MKNNWLELSVDDLTFEDIVRIFGKEQQMFIDQLYLFEYKKKSINDDEYNENYFADIYLTLEMFSRFLQSIGNYEIIEMTFEIEDGTLFRIEDGAVTLSVHHDNEAYILNALSQLKSEYFAPLYQKSFEKDMIHYLNKKSTNVINHDNKLMNQFELCIN